MLYGHEIKAMLFWRRIFDHFGKIHISRICIFPKWSNKIFRFWITFEIFNIWNTILHVLACTLCNIIR